METDTELSDGGCVLASERMAARLRAAGYTDADLVSGMFGDPDGNGVHGLNERIRVNSLHDGRDVLYGRVKIYAMGG